MAVVHSPSSELGKELAKWEQHPSAYTVGNDEQGNPIQPGNPYRYRPYPKAVYKAAKDTNGKVVCMPGQPNPGMFLDANSYNLACRRAEMLEQQCYKTVGDDDELAKAKRDGWCESPQAAIAHFESLERDIANAAAERHFTDQRLSERARAEAAAADAATSDHVADVPRKKSRD